MRKRLVTIIFAFLITIGIAFALLYTPMRKACYPLKFESIISSCAEEYELEPELVAAIIFCESSFRADAVSHAGAKGLMQLTPDTYDWVLWRMGETHSAEEIVDPNINISCGCYLMRFLLDKFECTETALAGYNAGYGAVGNWLADTRYSDDGVHLKEIPYSETKNYVEKVMKIKEIYKELYFKED